MKSLFNDQERIDFQINCFRNQDAPRSDKITIFTAQCSIRNLIFFLHFYLISDWIYQFQFPQFIALLTTFLKLFLERFSYSQILNNNYVALPITKLFCSINSRKYSPFPNISCGSFIIISKPSFAVASISRQTKQVNIFAFFTS